MKRTGDERKAVLCWKKKGKGPVTSLKPFHNTLAKHCPSLNSAFSIGLIFCFKELLLTFLSSLQNICQSQSQNISFCTNPWGFCELHHCLKLCLTSEALLQSRRALRSIVQPVLHKHALNTVTQSTSADRACSVYFRKCSVFIFRKKHHRFL